MREVFVEIVVMVYVAFAVVMVDVVVVVGIAERGPQASRSNGNGVVLWVGVATITVEGNLVWRFVAAIVGKDECLDVRYSVTDVSYNLVCREVRTKLFCCLVVKPEAKCEVSDDLFGVAFEGDDVWTV